MIIVYTRTSPAPRATHVRYEWEARPKAPETLLRGDEACRLQLPLPTHEAPLMQDWKAPQAPIAHSFTLSS
jgi:hypothetical protein